MNPEKAPGRRRPGAARNVTTVLAMAITVAAASALSAGSGAGASRTAALQPQTDAQALVEFETRVAEYRALREAVEISPPRAPDRSHA